MYILKYSEVVKLLEDLVNTPTYMLVGYGEGGLLILRSDEGGFSSLWILDTGSLSKKRITKKPVSAEAEMPVKASRVVYTVDVMRGREQHVIHIVNLSKVDEEIPVDMKPMRVVGLVDSGEKIFFTGATVEDVAIYMVEDGKAEKLYKLQRGFAFVTDAKKHMVTGYGVLAGNPFSTEVFVYNVESGEFKVYTPKPGSVNKEPVIVKRDMLVFASSAFTEERDVLVELDLEREEFRELKLPGKDYYEDLPVEHVYYNQYEGEWLVIGKRNGRTKIFLNGHEIAPVAGTAHKAVYVDGKLYYSYSSLKKPGEIVEVDVRHNTSRILLESKPPKEVESTLGNVEFKKVKTSNTLDIPTWVIESKKAGKPGPTVIYVHGGPWAEVADAWRVTLIALVAAGFNVVAPNFRGSTGYGEWFRKMDIGDPGGGDLEDVVTVTKWAVETGLADKVLIAGYSYGGYMTLWAMSNQPELYDCGVAGASVVDWEEMYGLSDAVFRAFIDVLFAGRHELLKERSPITKAPNITKPLCIIHPQNDTRTPLKPVLKLLSLLLERDKSFEAHIVPDLGHAINTIEDAMKILLPMVLFLKKCVEKS